MQDRTTPPTILARVPHCQTDPQSWKRESDPTMRTLLMTTLTAALASLSPLSAFCQAPAAERPWTLMIYGAADNDAEGPILGFLDKVRAALDDDPGMELLLFIDRSGGFSDDSESLGADFAGARVYRLGRESAELLDASAYFPGMSPDREEEVDSADPHNLGRFVAFCKDRYPARRYGLMIYGHANGAEMCPDDTSQTTMQIPELSDEVDEGASVDFLALELCNMGGIEIAYQWRPGNGGFSAEVLLAIPNAGIPLDWDRAFSRIRSTGHATTAEGDVLDPETMTALDFGRLVIEEGYAGRKAHLERAVRAGLLDLDNPDHREHVREAAGCYDLSAAELVKTSLDELAVALAESGAREVVMELCGSSDDERLMNYAPRGKFDRRPYVDLYELLDLLAGSAKLVEPARSAAVLARDAVDELVDASFGAEVGFAGFKPGRNGIFIVLPDGNAISRRSDGAEPPAWSQLTWYTPLTASEPRDPYGRWSFLADGATPGNGRVENWFELLDAWFDDPDAGPEGLNRYAW